MNISIFELHRFNGVESYRILQAICNAYEKDGETEIVFFVESSEAIKTLSDTEEIRAVPFIEIGVRTDRSVSNVFDSGLSYTSVSAYNNITSEWMTNLYYCGHQGVNNVLISIESTDATSVIAKIEGTTNDVNYYDGSKPETKLFIKAVFRKHPDARKSFA